MTKQIHNCRVFGWCCLCVWAVAGVGLESAQAFKVAVVLDDELTRLLLRLAHAHGAVLALVVLAFASEGAPLFLGEPRRGRLAGRLLRLGALLVPLGFVLGTIAHPESDPALGILLTPLGALCLIGGLVLTALAAFKSGLQASDPRD